MSRRVLVRSLRTNPYSVIHGKYHNRREYSKSSGEEPREKHLRSTTLHERVAEWDKSLPVMHLPPLSSLVDYLVRRKCGSRDSSKRTGLTRWAVDKAVRMCGLQRAHQRLQDDHDKDPVDNCWYCPGNHGDTFGIRPDEVYFHEKIISSQPVSSYAVLLRGSPRYPCSAVSDGIARSNVEEQNIDWGDWGESAPGSLDAMINRAASLVLSLLEAKKFYFSDKFEQERFREKPLSMQWYRHIFSTSMQFHPGCIERYTTPPGARTSHIVVMVIGVLYKVDVLVENEHGSEVPVSYQHLVKQFTAIIEDARSRVDTVPVGILTTLPPSQRWKDEQKLKTLSSRNHSNLSLIRDSLFAVCLDPDVTPTTTNDAMYSLYSQSPANRWFDKSIQLVVLGNGVAGFIGNYLAGMTGTVATNFVGKVVRNEYQFGGTDNKTDTNLEKGLTYSRLIWEDSHDRFLATRTTDICRATHVTGPFKPLSHDVFTLPLGYDFEKLCQTKRISPGGAFQAALQVALARMRDDGSAPQVMEVVSLRHVRFGGMTFMDSSLADMRIFVEHSTNLATGNELFSDIVTSEKTLEQYQHLQELLLRAVKEYKQAVVQYKKGEVYLWHLDALYRQLKLPSRLPTWGGLAKPSGLIESYRSMLVAFLQNPLIDTLPAQVPHNVTSNPLWVPEIEAIGRPGVKCILPPKSMALHYVFGRNAISITVNANTGHPCNGNEERFAEHLKETISLVRALLTLKPDQTQTQ